MYVLVHHDIHAPASFWSTAEKAIPAEAENREGVAMPSGVERGTAATA